jgi:hypothetical protein
MAIGKSTTGEKETRRFQEYLSVIFCLRNQEDCKKTLSLTKEAWYGILELAEGYGWNPLGTRLPNQWVEQDFALAGYYLDEPSNWLDEDSPVDGWAYDRWVDDSETDGGRTDPAQEEDFEPRLVTLEDALNLADALEQAFIDYEPLRVPDSFYFFEPAEEVYRLRPSIGAISETFQFCRAGAFWIEPYRKA